jgi:hypothetical protein
LAPPPLMNPLLCENVVARRTDRMDLLSLRV